MGLSTPHSLRLAEKGTITSVPDVPGVPLVPKKAEPKPRLACSICSIRYLTLVWISS